MIYEAGASCPGIPKRELGNERETFPKIGADIRFMEDKRTFVLPVELEPEKTYVLWFNSDQHNNFRDTENNPAVPYLLVFQTAKAK